MVTLQDFIHRRRSWNHLVQHTKHNHRKVLLTSFYLDGHTLGTYPQTQMFESPCTVWKSRLLELLAFNLNSHDQDLQEAYVHLLELSSCNKNYTFQLGIFLEEKQPLMEWTMTWLSCYSSQWLLTLFPIRRALNLLSGTELGLSKSWLISGFFLFCSFKFSLVLKHNSFVYFQVDFDVVLDNLKKLRENCKKSWEYLSVVAKHDSTKQLKSKWVINLVLSDKWSLDAH